MNNITDKLNEEAYTYFEKAYNMSNKDDKKLIVKCIVSLAKENIKTALEFMSKNNLN